MQATLGTAVRIDGKGLHSGASCWAEIAPAPAGSGILFAVSGARTVSLDRMARLDHPRCSGLSVGGGGAVLTVEHLLAAIRICRVDNAVVTVGGGEVPILDGSALPWLEAIEEAGVLRQPSASMALRVIRPTAFEMGASSYRVIPGPASLSVVIEYPETPIGIQAHRCGEDGFRDLAHARTFALESEVAALREARLALGGGLDNAVVIGDEGPINPGGFRVPLECVMHKSLDLLGDLMLCGRRIEGRVQARRPGHASNRALLEALFARGCLEAVASPETGSMAA